jgi:hypothetical protein
MTIRDVQNELADFEFMLDNVPKVYSEVTGGSMSYPNYDASSVISEFNNHIEDYIKPNAIEDFKESAEYVELLEDYHAFYTSPMMDADNPKPQLYVEYLDNQMNGCGV